MAGNIVSTTINFDSHIQKVILGDGGSTGSWTTSGSTDYISQATALPFNVTLDEGYILDTIVVTGMELASKTDTSFTLSDPTGQTYECTITLTSKQATTSNPYVTLDIKQGILEVHVSQGDYIDTSFAYGSSSNGFTVTKSDPITITITNLESGYALDTITSTSSTTSFEKVNDTTVTMSTTASMYDEQTITLSSKTVASTGETWILNETLEETSLTKTSINFTSNSEIFTYISCDFHFGETSLSYGGTIVYSGLTGSTSWSNEAYRTITFNEPVTDTTLLAWLQANGTKQDTSSLTGEYIFVNNINTNGFTSFTDTTPFTCNGVSYESMTIAIVESEYISIPIVQISYGSTLAYFNIGDTEGGPAGWQDEKYRKIDFGDNTVSASSNLGKFLVVNAVSTSRPYIDLSSLSTWANISFGSHTVKIVAKANNYKDSEPSEAVTFTKEKKTYAILIEPINVTEDSSNPGTIQEEDSATLKFIVDNGYEMPDSVEITNATSSWNKSTGTLTVSNPTGTVGGTIEATAIEYTISSTLTNVTGATDNPTTITVDSDKTLTFTANTGYTLPDTVTVTNAEYSWDKSTGKLTLSKPSGNVTVSVTGVSSGVTLEAGTYKWVDSPTSTARGEQQLSFVSNQQNCIKIVWSAIGSITYYFDETNYSGVYNKSLDAWTNDAYKTITLSTDQTVSQEFYDWAITGGNLVKQGATKTFTLPTTLEMGGGTTSLVADGYTITQGDIQVSENVYNALTALNAGGSLTDFGNTCGLTIPSNMVLFFKMGARLIPGSDAEVTDDGKYRAEISNIGGLTAKQTGIHAIEFNFVNNTATYTAIEAENIDPENHLIIVDGTFGENNLVVFCYEGSTTHVLKAGHYKWIETPVGISSITYANFEGTSGNNQLLTYLANMTTDSKLHNINYVLSTSSQSSKNDISIQAGDVGFSVEVYDSNSGWADDGHRVIILLDDQEISDAFYNSVVANGNLVELSASTYKLTSSYENATILVNTQDVTLPYSLYDTDVIYIKNNSSTTDVNVNGNYRQTSSKEFTLANIDIDLQTFDSSDGNKAATSIIFRALEGPNIITLPGGGPHGPEAGNLWVSAGDTLNVTAGGDFTGTPTLFTAMNGANVVEVGEKGYEWLPKINNDEVADFGDVATAFDVTDTNKGTTIDEPSQWIFALTFSGILTNENGQYGGSIDGWNATFETLTDSTLDDILLAIYNTNNDTIELFEPDLYDVETGEIEFTATISNDTILAILQRIPEE